MLISILLFLSALFGLFIDNVHAEVINNKISSISKEITVDGLKENLDIEISYNTISNSDYITKGEFIHNLLDHLDVERLELNDSTYEFHFQIHITVHMVWMQNMHGVMVCYQMMKNI